MDISFSRFNAFFIYCNIKVKLLMLFIILLSNKTLVEIIAEGKREIYLKTVKEEIDHQLENINFEGSF